MSQKPHPCRVLWLSECCLSPSDLPRDVLTSLPGASVSLSCPAKDLRDNATVHWMVTNTHQRWAGVGPRLLLRSVQFSDSGNYSCYVNGHQAGTVRLLVEGEWWPLPGRDMVPKLPERFTPLLSLAQKSQGEVSDGTSEIWRGFLLSGEYCAAGLGRCWSVVWDLGPGGLGWNPASSPLLKFSVPQIPPAK